MASLPQQHRPGSRLCRLAPVLAADTREPRLCAALRAYAVPPSAGYGFVMHPHEHFELALGFLDFEQRGQFEARQAGECRRPLLIGTRFLQSLHI